MILPLPSGDEKSHEQQTTITSTDPLSDTPSSRSSVCYDSNFLEWC